MKPMILPLLLALAGCAAPAPAPSGGGGIVSTNPCADAILIALVDPARIAAISSYSKDPAASSISADVARRFAATAGTAEEVIARNPDLVLTSSFTPASTRDAYARAGLKVLLLDSPATIAASKAQVAEIAAAVGAVGRGRALNARIDAAVRAAAFMGASPIAAPSTASPAKAGAQLGNEDGRGRRVVTAAIPTGPRPSPGKRNPRNPSALLFIVGTLATGPGTLLDEMLTLTGFTDAATGYGLASTGAVPIETIAAHPPDLILAPIPSRTATLRARVLARMGAGTRQAVFPRHLINCGGPTIIPALATLAALRRRMDP